MDTDDLRKNPVSQIDPELFRLHRTRSPCTSALALAVPKGVVGKSVPGLDATGEASPLEEDKGRRGGGGSSFEKMLSSSESESLNESSKQKTS